MYVAANDEWDGDVEPPGLGPDLQGRSGDPAEGVKERGSWTGLKVPEGVATYLVDKE